MEHLDRAELLARVEGVDRAVIRPVLDAALDHHVHPPPPDAIARAGRRRLQAWVTHPAVGRMFPGVDRVAWPPLAELDGAERSELVRAAERDVDAAVAAGLPEAVATSAWLEGALSAFDPWTRVVWPAEMAGWEAHHRGVEVGIGAEVEPAGDGLEVVLPIPGGPAWEAGVHQGDRIVAVRDGEGWVRAGADGPAALARALPGPEGSTVGLEVLRDGAPLRFDLVRAPVPATTAHGWTVGPDNAPVVAIPGHPGVAYVHVDRFVPHTDEEVGALLGEARPDAVVLDLRGNGGGDVQAAVNLVDLFAADGIAARLEGPGAPPPPADGQAAWNALLPGDPLEGVPVAVLVDRDTASAAEIAAGGLKGRDGAVLVGERTWGKGWSQGLIVDPGGRFALQVTNSEWKLPDGARLHRVPGAARWGVDPDVPFPESAAESWQNRARRAAREFPRIHADGSPMAPPDPGRNPALPVLDHDPTVARAVQALAELAGDQASAPPHDEPEPAVHPKQ